MDTVSVTCWQRKAAFESLIIAGDTMAPNYVELASRVNLNTTYLFHNFVFPNKCLYHEECESEED